MSVDRRISQSSADFANVVWPQFAAEFGGGELVMSETAKAGLGRALDLFAMTDAWQVVAAHGARSFASRVQWGTINWESWTIRSRRRSGIRTEIHKMAAAGEGWHLPSYFVQAYITAPGGTLISAAAIKGVDLRSMLDKPWLTRGPRVNPEDGTEFHWIAWEDAERYGLEVIRRPKNWFLIDRPVT